MAISVNNRLNVIDRRYTITEEEDCDEELCVAYKLEIKSVTTADSGTYVCTAVPVGTEGSFTEATVHVDVMAGQ